MIKKGTHNTSHKRLNRQHPREDTHKTSHLRDSLDSILKSWEAKCWRMHLSVTQSPYELSITCTVLETFQFSDIVTCQLCFFAHAVILSRHQVYLCKELCVLERKFWLEFGVKGKVSHEHTIFMINMLTGIKLRKNGQQKRATCFATLLQNELKNYVARFTTHQSNLR